jgi:hypothetical protein
MAAIYGWTKGQETTVAGLKLLALLALRPGELRAATWDEIDLEAGVWTVPASRTKMRRPHRTPLPLQAVATLQELRGATRSAISSFVFPATVSVRKPMSENTLNFALRRLDIGAEEMTAHGFRAAFATLANESRRWHPDAIERQLAHVEGNNVRRAYTRGEHWDERVLMMQWWADELDRLREAAIAEAAPKPIPGAGPQSFNQFVSDGRRRRFPLSVGGGLGAAILRRLYRASAGGGENFRSDAPLEATVREWRRVLPAAHLDANFR